VGLRTVTELRGAQRIPLEITPPNKKLITCSRSFGAATSIINELRAAIAFYVARAAEKLRRQKLAAGTITVFIETDRFRAVAKTRFICVFNNFACLSPSQNFRNQNLILS
jgi:impB/mucB/samB family protein